MAVKFLSEDWISAVNEALAGDDEYKSSTATTEISLQFEVSDAPDGDVQYSVTMGNGATAFSLGAMAEADATIRNDYETASAVSKGDLNTQAAFISGKLKVEGNLAKIMMNQAALTNLANSLSGMDIEY